MRALQIAADVLVWALAVLGVVSAGLWVAGAVGLVKPLVVISGSMEPEIMTGDLLLATPVPVDEVEVGDVLSLPNPVTGALVTHRVVDVAQQADGAWHVWMQGDANDAADGGAYVVTDDTVLRPRWQVGGAGTALVRLTTPGTAVPLVVALVALLGLSQLPRSSSGPARGRHAAASTTAARSTSVASVPEPHAVADPTDPTSAQEDACDPLVDSSRPRSVR
ncbi:signal peptidase I [Cellulomonas dongxiuzhuiae]|uniref:Signal peptidase I n=1 Tax=Cellulomonas dongxiuzhuiae TaxID=2819979 RepID=A0ABX8GKK7_9CELL|nr:signal peptidase I [Cellulomonas dongxiuzhuiae]MBO3096290.1 signal peptidase I [Cellulomonas dongxiuzhuiae]QWC16709.1 signal peptidase I [Cellulomonas dongxiuzhuiae]